MEGTTHSTHPFHHCGQKCVENHIIQFQFYIFSSSFGEKVLHYMLQTWITTHDCTRVVTTMVIVEKCLAQFWAGPRQWFSQITSWAWLQLAFARHQYCGPWWVKFHCWRRKHWHLIHRLWLGRLACWLSYAHLVQKSQSQIYPPAEHFTMLRFFHYKNSYLLHLIVKYVNIIILMIPIVL